MEGDQLNAASTFSVLIVDDEEFVADYFSDLLLSRGCTTTVFYDSMAALDNFKSSINHYDLVLSDICMPNMDGEQLAKNILNIRPDMPIILCSGYTPYTGQKKLQEMGIKDFLPKPIESGRLLDIVEELRSA